jgi:hypothetical protein
VLFLSGEYATTDSNPGGIAVPVLVPDSSRLDVEPAWLVIQVELPSPAGDDERPGGAGVDFAATEPWVVLFQNLTSTTRCSSGGELIMRHPTTMVVIDIHLRSSV